MKALEIMIQIYQKWVSPAFAPRCKYYPSCSQYTLIAIRRFGVKGVFLGLWRFIRCNPWSHGGVDYPPQTIEKQWNSTTLQEVK